MVRQCLGHNKALCVVISLSVLSKARRVPFVMEALEKAARCVRHQNIWRKERRDLAESRPHFISFYLPEVDHAGHTYGPDAPQTREAVQFVDSALLQLTEAVRGTGLPVNYIFVSDHGMTKVDTAHPVLFPEIDTSKAVMTSGGELVQLYVKNKNDQVAFYRQLKKVAKGYSVVWKKELSTELHYGQEDDRMNRIGDILLIPDWPAIFVSPGKKPKTGAHGFNPYKVADMRAVFYAWGPGIKNKRVMPIKNVDIFPVVTELLGLTYPGKIDGSKKLAKKIVKRTKSQ